MVENDSFTIEEPALSKRTHRWIRIGESNSANRIEKKEQSQMDLTMLVNAAHPLPLEWEPDDLVDLWKVQPRHFHLFPRQTRLAACAADAANALFEHAEHEGLDNFLLLSGYRTSDYQAGLFMGNPFGSVARPGCSEHQTGLAMDIALLGRGLSLDDAYRHWLAENCWEYGFVVRYPEGREDVTGIPAEPWHLRYVGREVALEMRNRGWVLEEWCEAHGRIEHDPLAELERDCLDRWVGMNVHSTGIVATRRMLYDNRAETNMTYYASLVDYVRYREIELLAEELKRAHVSGAVAEVGVEFGYTSEVLNRTFPDSKLYLYDSFDGFDDAAVAEEHEKFGLPLDFSENWGLRRPEPDVCRQLVLRRLPNRENAVIRQGCFPNTAYENDCDVVFAFVVLDVDLYRTTLEGVEFFWPRLAEGGYLMIHDYNSDHLKGIYDAVADAEKKFGRFIRVPIPDEGGSLVIQKPF